MVPLQSLVLPQLLQELHLHAPRGLVADEGARPWGGALTNRQRSVLRDTASARSMESTSCILSTPLIPSPSPLVPRITFTPTSAGANAGFRADTRVERVESIGRFGSHSAVAEGWAAAGGRKSAPLDQLDSLAFFLLAWHELHLRPRALRLRRGDGNARGGKRRAGSSTA